LSASALFDSEEMMDRVGDDLELLEEMVEILVEESPEMLAQLRAALAAGDSETVERVGHAFKGSVANFAAPAATATAFALEQGGRNGDLAEAGALIDRLQQQYEELVVALNDFVAQGGR